MSSPAKKQIDTGHVQTTNATTTTIFSIATPTDSTGFTEVIILARNASNGDSNAYRNLLFWENSSGTVTAPAVTSEPTDYVAEEDAAWSHTISISGSNIDVKGTGSAATTVDWVGWATSIINEP